jgi:hypothetical protein
MRQTKTYTTQVQELARLMAFHVIGMHDRSKGPDEGEERQVAEFAGDNHCCQCDIGARHIPEFRNSLIQPGST